jgi:DNA helicase-2/ATP-dependent DNA helicase PcrA
MIDLNRLNPMQLKAVQQMQGPVLILAGAGSGKTHALTYRIAWLLEKGVSPYNIIAITFTNKAAREMRNRVNNLNEKGEQVWVSTFHSTCARILRREAEHINYDNSFSIMDADDAQKLIKACVKELNLNEKQFPVYTVMTYISKNKDQFIDAASAEGLTAGGLTAGGLTAGGLNYREGNLARIYGLYQKRLKNNNCMDFDDLIFNTVLLFSTCPNVLQKYQDRFKYVLVDEYQDTNGLQFRLARLLAEKYHNICVVGDDDQSIYGWRGANINNILDFEKHYPGTITIRLEQNYRSTQTILDAANAVIRNNSYRKGKNLWTQNDQGIKITYYRADDDRDEGSFVTGMIEERIKHGAKYSDFAVLYRINAQSRAIEDQMVRYGIPYRLFGGVRFYQRMEIKDILAYLKAIYNPADSVSYTRIINVPKRGIGAATVDLISRHAIENDITFYAALNEVDTLYLGNRGKKVKEFVELMNKLREESYKNSIAQFLRIVLGETGYVQELLNAGESEIITSRLENINELLNKAAEYEKERGEEATLAAFLEEVALVADVDAYDENDDAAVMMTLHSAKGLEFPCVFLVGVEEGIFPGYRASMAPTKEPLEEERRLCYVGITRAKKELYITSALERMHNGQIVSNSPSRFINEIPKQYLTTI